jgi:hypothetical protein
MSIESDNELEFLMSIMFPFDSCVLVRFRLNEHDIHDPGEKSFRSMYDTLISGNFT